MSNEIKQGDSVLTVGGPTAELGMRGKVEQIIESRMFACAVNLNGNTCYYHRHELLRLNGKSEDESTTESKDQKVPV